MGWEWGMEMENEFISMGTRTIEGAKGVRRKG